MIKMKFASFLLLACFALTLRAEPYFFKPAGWPLGTEFPSEPKVRETRTPKPEGDIVTAQAMLQTDSEAFAATKVHNPVPIAKEQLAEAYNGARDGMLRMARATLVSEEKIKTLGRDSRRYVFTCNEGAMTCHARMVVIGDELFIFMHVQPTGQADSAAAEAFFSKISE